MKQRTSDSILHGNYVTPWQWSFWHRLLPCQIGRRPSIWYCTSNDLHSPTSVMDLQQSCRLSVYCKKRQEHGMQFKMKVVSLIRLMLGFPWLSTITWHDNPGGHFPGKEWPRIQILKWLSIRHQKSQPPLQVINDHDFLCMKTIWYTETHFTYDTIQDFPDFSGKLVLLFQGTLPIRPVPYWNPILSCGFLSCGVIETVG